MNEYTNRLFELKLASEKLIKLLHAVAKSRFSSELEPLELNIVWYIGLYKHSMKPLCEQFQKKNSTMTGIIDRMEKKGIINREVDVLDRRVVAVSLTKKWRRKYNHIMKWQEIYAKIAYEALTQERVDTLLKLLLETNDCIEQKFSLAKKLNS